jgi:hypothetical protein
LGAPNLNQFHGRRVVTLEEFLKGVMKSPDLIVLEARAMRIKGRG